MCALAIRARSSGFGFARCVARLSFTRKKVLRAESVLRWARLRIRISRRRRFRFMTVGGTHGWGLPAGVKAFEKDPD